MRHQMYYRANRLKAKRLKISLSAATKCGPEQGYAMSGDEWTDVTVFLRTGEQQQALYRGLKSAGIVMKDPVAKGHGMEFGVKSNNMQSFEKVLQKIGLRFEKHEMY